MADSDRPGDVYTAVLRLVQAELEKEKDPEMVELAEALKSQVDRKTIKQTVMTSVYGVTFIGAKAQIQKQLAAKKAFETNSELFWASNYLAKLTIQCIGDLFEDANKIKQWFSKSAKVVANTNESVKWLTPMGLPCVQPYKTISAS